MALSRGYREPTALATSSPSSSRPQGILSRKRTNKDIADSSDTEPPRSSKRLKVEFDSDVEIKYFDEQHGDKSAEVIQEEVRQAIRQRADGASEQYGYIKRLFDAQADADDAPSALMLQRYIYALSNNTALLKRSCSDLVNAVLGMKWLARDQTFVALYTRFLRHLASSQSVYTNKIMHTLVQNFAHLSTSADYHTTHTTLTRKQLQQRVHTALRCILQLVPAASGSLSTIITSTFPPLNDSKTAHIEYVRNILTVAEYAPELRSQILDLITDRSIKLDVQVQTDVDDLEDDTIADALVQGQPLSESQVTLKSETDSDNVDAWSDEEADDESDDEEDSEEKRVKTLKSSIEKMDALLDILFEHYTLTFSKGSQTDMSATYDQLILQFRKSILPTYRSRHTQFVLFHFAQSTSAFTINFVDICMEILMDRNRPYVLRRSAGAYVASFIARGAHISADDVLYTFSKLSKYLDQLRREYEPTCRGPDPQRYTAYYVTCQALIYIFCFRYRALLADPDDYDEEDEDAIFDDRELVFAPGVKDVFIQNLFSKLNPLKICAPEIVEEFEKITRHLHFIYIYHVIDANKRLRLSQYTPTASNGMSRETALTGLHGERRQQLEAYFPFDPYRLRISKRWLAGDYNEWRGIPGVEEEAVHDSSVMEDDADDDEEELDDRTETPSDSE